MIDRVGSALFALFVARWGAWSLAPCPRVDHSGREEKLAHGLGMSLSLYSSWLHPNEGNGMNREEHVDERRSSDC